MKNLVFRVALTFAVFGYLIAVGLCLAPASWPFRSSTVLTICPPIFLTMVSMTDPSLTTVAVILAPLNALVYGIAGFLIGLVVKGVTLALRNRTRLG